MNIWFNRFIAKLDGHPAEAVLQAYANGELEGGVRSRVYRHVRICPSCRDAVEADRELLRFITSVDPGATALAATREKLFEKIRSESPGVVGARMHKEIAGLLGRAAADRLTGVSGSIPPPVESQMVALLGARAAARFRQRWAGAAA